MMFLALLSARFITAGSLWLTWMATLCVAVGWDLVILDCSAFLTGACASAAGTRTSPSRAARPTGATRAMQLLIIAKDSPLGLGRTKTGRRPAKCGPVLAKTSLPARAPQAMPRRRRAPPPCSAPHPVTPQRLPRACALCCRPLETASTISDGQHHRCSAAAAIFGPNWDIVEARGRRPRRSTGARLSAWSIDRSGDSQATKTPGAGGPAGDRHDHARSGAPGALSSGPATSCLQPERSAAVQPRPEDYDYELDEALTSVVGVKSLIPADAFTADTLGTERAGNGVLIGRDGIVLTIGYLITEAETVWISHSGGRAVPAHVLGYDQETGFGLLQALARLDLPSLQLGSSAAVPVGADVVVGGAGGRARSVAARIIAKQEFAGYWEYVLDEAIFTAPAHPNWGGTAVIGPAGDLIGIGSLQIQQ